MIQVLDTQGICCTCNNYTTCMLLKNSHKKDAPILFCEKFDDSKVITNSNQKVPHDNKPIKSRRLGNRIEAIDEKGLCVNCEDNLICGFPNSGKKVIYCEEHISTCPDKRKVRRVSHEWVTRPCFGIKDLIGGGI